MTAAEHAVLLNKTNTGLNLILDVLNKRLTKLNEVPVVTDKVAHEAMMTAHTIQQIQMLVGGKP